jgi:osmotically-inducible protein OsmY
MANDRYRYDQDRYRNQDSDRRDREDDGYIARRGFGNERSGYDRGRERDFGDSAGYGSGGSALDWRDVVGDDDRRYLGQVFDNGRGRGQDRDHSDSFGRGSRDYNDRGFFDRAGDEVRSWFGDEQAEHRRDEDMRNAGQHRGRGPKGYQRSDARILDDVNDRLTDDPHIDASEIEVSVTNREVTLTGTVNSRFEKRHAEDIAESVSGVTHVQNNLRIQQYADAGMGGSMLSGPDAGTTGANRRTRNSSGM